MPSARFEWKPYALAVLLVGAAAALRFGLSLLEPNVLYFAVFFPAILLAALWGGPGPAILATSLSLFVVWFAFMPPYFEIGFKERANIINIGTFVASAALVIWIAELYRRALAELKAAEETRRLLVEEMRHRNRNSLTVANSLIRRTLAHDPATADNLSARLRVILDTDNVFEGNMPKGEMLHRVLLAELQPYGTERLRPLRRSSDPGPRPSPQPRARGSRTGNERHEIRRAISARRLSRGFLALRRR